MPRGFDRTQRVADLIQKVLATMLLQDTNDDRFRLITITGVTVSKDFSYAKIYVSVLTEDESKIKQIVRALNQEAKSFRRHLAREIDLRVTPELKFIYDESTARGFHLSTLIDSAMKKTEK
ncbi:MAG: ribosome-binding factor A [Gammaproteobacteria bacterium RIFCSPHIGHO2_12_FULL_37_14]|nr:MAG: ribosome-binding factor A [Gammaproteobacteria bacterium RIFCSPHIGHO2_12_FULL_37_14]